MPQRTWRATIDRLRSAGLLLLVVALARSPLPAQETCHQCLNGFRFLPSTVLGNPFANTYFQAATGGGMALDLNIPVRQLDGTVVDTIGGDIGFLLLDFEYQQAVTRWLALRASLTAVGRVGTSTEAIVASGASAAFGGALGATVPVWRRESILVSAVADVRSSSQYVVDPFGFVKTVVDSGYDENAKQVLLRDEAGGQWSAGVRAAWAIKPWVGLNAVLESGNIDVPNAGTESLTEMGLQAGFNFTPLWDVPLGLSLGFREKAGPGRSDVGGSYRIFELGAFYTGNRSFAIGGDMFWSRIKVPEFNVPDLDVVQFRLVTRLEF
jgi:hypothetical protein